MSTVHFELSVESTGCLISDLASTNGLFLNEKRVAHASLVDGDIIRAGRTLWDVTLSNANPLPIPTSAPAKPSATTLPPRSEQAIYPARPVQLEPHSPARSLQETPSLQSDLELISSLNQSRRLSPKERLTIGRTELSQWIFANDSQMSSCHMEVYHVGGQWWVRDMQSTNGLFVNDEPVSETPLHSADTLRAGQTYFQVNLPASELQTQLPSPESLEPLTTEELPVAPPPFNPHELPYFSLDDFNQTSDRKLADHTPPGKPLRALELDSHLEKASPPPPLEPEDWGGAATSDPIEPPTLALVGQESIPAVTGLHIHQASEEEAIGYQAFPCGSGLVLYRGVARNFDPIEVAKRLLVATSGWVLSGTEIEQCLETSEQAGASAQVDWLLPAKTDDPTWMLNLASTWGSDRTWLAYARGEMDDIRDNFLRLRSPAGSQSPALTILSPHTLAEFLANGGAVAVQRFFGPLDAILVEVHQGEQWALFGRQDLETSMQELNFVPRYQW